MLDRDGVGRWAGASDASALIGHRVGEARDLRLDVIPGVDVFSHAGFEDDGWRSRPGLNDVKLVAANIDLRVLFRLAEGCE